MFLVTTADQRTWKTDQKILFLGEWCKLYDQKEAWSKLDCEVLPYHWDDRKRFYQDYLYFRDVYERNLGLLADRLNEIHNVDHSKRYWRIIIGPWLLYFIGILLDKYFSIKFAVESGKVTGTRIISSSASQWTPNEMADTSYNSYTDEYNHYLYGFIIRQFSSIPFEEVHSDNVCGTTVSANRSSAFYQKVAKSMLGFFSKLVPDRLNGVVMVTRNIPLYNLARLQISMGQIPYLYMPSIGVPVTAVEEKLRKKLLYDKAEDPFEECLRKLIPWQIPKAYMEGYTLLKCAVENSFPRKVQTIYTDNANVFNEAFKFWVAGKVEGKAKFVMGQHGGLYGAGLWSCDEEHEIAISDRYFTWGWKSDANSSLKPLPVVRNSIMKNKIKVDPNGLILWVFACLPRYAYWLSSIPVASQMLHYFDEQRRFASNTLPEVRDLLLLKLYKIDYSWFQESRWRDFNPSLKIYKGTRPMSKFLDKGRLFIGTYNSTTYLETLSFNFPTIIFWKPEHWEIRHSAKPYYDELHRVGILHYTPESAAKKVNEIYSDTLGWWNQPEIQKVRAEYCRRFSRTSKNWKEEWKKELLDIAEN